MILAYTLAFGTIAVNNYRPYDSHNGFSEKIFFFVDATTQCKAILIYIFINLDIVVHFGADLMYY